MTILYNDSFEADTVGQPVAGWFGTRAILSPGSPNGAFICSSTNPIKGARSFQMANIDTGTMMVRPAALDCDIVFCWRFVGVASAAGFLGFGAAIRCDASGNALIMNMDFTNPLVSNIHILSSTNYSLVGSGSNSLATLLGKTPVAGDIVWVRCQTQGTSLRCRIWMDGSSEPTTWEINSPIAGGFTGTNVGFISTNTITAPLPTATVDNVTISDFNIPVVTYVPPTNPAFSYRGRWNVVGATATAINPESIIEYNFTGPRSDAYFKYIGSHAPDVFVSLDGGTPTRYSISTNPSVVSLTGANTAHSVLIWAVIPMGTVAAGFISDTWVNQNGGLQFLGTDVTFGTLNVPSPAPNIIEFLGDSITSGLRLLYNNVTERDTGDQQPPLAFPWLVANTIGYRPYPCGHGGQGITTTGSNGAPIANSGFPFIYNGVPYTPSIQPKIIMIYFGMNDASFTAAQYQTYLTTVRAARPTARIFAICPHTKTGLAAPIQAAVLAMADPQIKFADFSTGVLVAGDLPDGMHPNVSGDAKIATAMVNLIGAMSYTTAFTAGSGKVGSPQTVTMTPVGAYTGAIVLTPSGCGLSSPASVSYANESTAKTVTFTPKIAGNLFVTAISNPVITNPAPIMKKIKAPTVAKSANGKSLEENPINPDARNLQLRASSNEASYNVVKSHLVDTSRAVDQGFPVGGKKF